jgi:stress response protein YsnF
VETGRVAVTRVTREQSEVVAETLGQESVEIRRTQIGRQIETMPHVRQEDDTIVIPIVEERLVVERRLFLKEEVRVRLVSSRKTHRQVVCLRHHEVVVSSLPAQVPPAKPGSAADDNGRTQQEN